MSLLGAVESADWMGASMAAAGTQVANAAVHIMSACAKPASMEKMNQEVRRGLEAADSESVR